MGKARLQKVVKLVAENTPSSSSSEESDHMGEPDQLVRDATSG
jgi:hypothetical protein